MRLARILCILFPLALAAADDPSGWAAAKWGMTPDEVKTAVPEAHELSGPTPERTFYVAEEKKLATVGIDRTDIAGTSWKVFLGFEGPKGLTGVWLTG